MVSPVVPASDFRVMFGWGYPGTPASLLQQHDAIAMDCFNPTPYVFDQQPNGATPVPTVERMKLGIERMVAAASSSSDWPFGVAEHLCLDWEDFWLMVGQGSTDNGDPNLTTTRQNLSRFAESARRFRQALNETGHGDKKFGFYGVAPIDAWFAVMAAPGSALYQRQVLAHHLPEMAEVIQAVDFLTSTVYLPVNPTQANWSHLENTLLMAREITQGKPLYVFTWPQFAGGTGYMDRDNWIRQMNLARKYGNGIIFFGTTLTPGADPRWNPDASWWTTAIEWMGVNR